MNKRIFLAAFFLVVAIVAFIFLANLNASTPKSGLQVVTSFYPLYFFTTQLALDKADVSIITPAGVEPHDYELTARQNGQIQDSDLLIINGSFEPWASDVKKNLNSQDTLVVTVGEEIMSQRIVDEKENILDPHIWLSPVLAKQMVDRITLALIQVDPDNKEYYQTHEDVLMDKLNNLDMVYKEGLANCQTRNFVTSHNAFGYLADAYGLVQIPIAGLSPDAEPSAQQLAATAKFVKENKIKYIFFESLVSPKLSNTIATEVGAQTLVLDPLEGLSEEDIVEGKNYFTQMKQNLTNLKIALECSPR